MSNFTAKLWMPRVKRMNEDLQQFQLNSQRFLMEMQERFDLFGEDCEFSIKQINFMNSLWEEFQ